MRTALLVVASLVVAACSGDDGSPQPGVDAPASIDAPASDGGAIDAPMGTVCTGAAYDPCTDNTQCTSANCKLFMQQGITVCTQACSASVPCPMQNGAAVPCNGMGLCRPSAANTCTR